MPLVGHLHLGTRLLGWRVGQRREALLPTRMMGIAARGDGGLDAALFTRRQGRGASIPGRKSPPPPACQSPMEWQRVWVRLLESRWGD